MSIEKMSVVKSDSNTGLEIFKPSQVNYFYSYAVPGALTAAALVGVVYGVNTGVVSLAQVPFLGRYVSVFPSIPDNVNTVATAVKSVHGVIYNNYNAGEDFVCKLSGFVGSSLSELGKFVYPYTVAPVLESALTVPLIKSLAPSIEAASTIATTNLSPAAKMVYQIGKVAVNFSLANVSDLYRDVYETSKIAEAGDVGAFMYKFGKLSGELAVLNITKDAVYTVYDYYQKGASLVNDILDSVDQGAKYAYQVANDILDNVDQGAKYAYEVASESIKYVDSFEVVQETKAVSADLVKIVSDYVAEKKQVADEFVNKTIQVSEDALDSFNSSASELVQNFSEYTVNALEVAGLSVMYYHESVTNM